MSRIEGADPAGLETPIRRVLQGQAEIWGAPLANHLVYARRPSLFRAFRGVWLVLNKDTVLDEKLVALVNRRVAGINGCLF
jgi:hypothetical protein